MRTYGRIPCKQWQDQKIRALGKDAIHLANYLRSSPHSNMMMLYYLPPVYMAHETMLPEETCLALLEKLRDIGFCHVDFESSVVWLQRDMEDELGKALKPGDNRIKGILSALDSLPESELKDEFVYQYRESYLEVSQEKPKPPYKPPYKPETGTETGAETYQETVPSSSSGTFPSSGTGAQTHENRADRSPSDEKSAEPKKKGHLSEIPEPGTPEREAWEQKRALELHKAGMPLNALQNYATNRRNQK